ncbi:MAG: hypothetical protein KKA07_11600 [Bacteroidetes bacterium]|nr:hypothetical protein [Bacteroidota bacterium]
MRGIRQVQSWVLICLFVFVINGTGYAQQGSGVTPDSRLYEVFEKSVVDDWVKNSPEKIQYYNYYLENCFYTVQLNTAEKPITGEDIHTVSYAEGILLKGNSFDEEVTGFSSKKFNALKYNFQIDSKIYVTYIWKEAGIALVFLPLKNIEAGFKKSLMNNNE